MSGLSAFERNQYFFGKLMTVRDFSDEQRYVMGKQQMHNRLLHDWGVVCGLRIRASDAGDPWRVVLEPGVALDACGREIVVPHACEFDLKALIEQAGLTRATEPFYLTIAYHDCRTEPVPVYARQQCGPQGDCAHNRVVEGYLLGLSTAAPDGQAAMVQQLCAAVQQAMAPPQTTVGNYRLVATIPEQEGAFAVAAISESAAAYGNGSRMLAHVANRSQQPPLISSLTRNAHRLAAGGGTIWAGLDKPGLSTSARQADGSYKQVGEDLRTNVLALAAMPSGEAAFLIHEDERGRRVVRVTPDGTVEHTAPLHIDGVTPELLAVTSDGKQLLIADNHTASVRLYDIGEGKLTAEEIPDLERMVDLAVHHEADRPGLLVVMESKAVYIAAPGAAPVPVAEGGTFSAGALQRNYAFVAEQGGLVWVHDLTGQEAPYKIQVQSKYIQEMAALPAASRHQVYVAGRAGLEVLEAEQNQTQGVDLYRLLCEANMDCVTCDPCAPEAVVLGQISLTDGRPAVDGCAGRRILLSSGHLLALMTCLTQSMAACCGKEQSPPPKTETQLRLEPNNQPQQPTDIFSLQAIATLLVDGVPVQEPVQIQFSISRDGAVLDDQTATTHLGKAECKFAVPFGHEYKLKATAVGYGVMATITMEAR